MTEQIAHTILDEYKPSNVKKMQDVLKEIFGPMFESILQGEMALFWWIMWLHFRGLGGSATMEYSI